MKLNVIGLSTVCSLLGIALSQSVEAGSLRADEGNDGWSTTISTNTTNSYGLNSGVTTQYIGTFSSGPLQDDVLGLNSGLNASSAVEYNYYQSGLPSASQIQSLQPEAQIIVYTLAGNTLADGLSSPNTNSDLPSTLKTAGDFEFEFNYSSTLTNTTGKAQFTFDNITYSAPVSALYAGDAPLLFSPTQGFVGSLVADTNGLVSLSNSLGDWKAGSSGTSAAPEIDSSSTIPALTLLAGMLLVVKGRRNSARVVLG
jgi:hypothetical protein